MNTQRELRGHDFLPSMDLELPQLYETEEIPMPNKVVHLHFFLGAMDWWVVEYDPTDGTAFAYMRDRDGTAWGYINLPDLERVRSSTGHVVERDLDWMPQTTAEARLPGDALLEDPIAP